MGLPMKRFFVLLSFGLIWLFATSLPGQNIQQLDFSHTKDGNLGNTQSDLYVIAFPVSGFYLVSLPLAVPDSSVSTLFPMVLGAFSWENNQYISVDTLQRGRGYWLAVTGPSAAFIEGTPFDQYSGHFTPGWHIIGSVLDVADFSDPIDIPDGSVLLPIFGWNFESQLYNQKTEIVQSNGYWMPVLQECDLVVGGDTTTTAITAAGGKLTKQAFEHLFGSEPPPPPIDRFPEFKHQVPQTPLLFQNYPNPFNPVTTFGFQISEIAMVDVSVFDLFGRKIRVLMHEPLSAGNYALEWDGRDEFGKRVSSGIYFYRLTAEQFTDTKRMILAQ